MLYLEIKHRMSHVKELTSLGLIDSTWIRNIDIFEQFHFYTNKGSNKSLAYVFCGEDFGVSWQSVRKIVLDLSK